MKRERQNKIMEIVRGKDIGTHEELVECLHKHGEDVTQSTLSRDLREMGVVKVPAGRGSFVYELSEEVNSGDFSTLDFQFSHFVTGVDRAQNLVVVHGIPGSGQGVARSIDKLNLSEVVGTVAGDDTIFVAVSNSKNVSKVMKYFEQAIKGKLKSRKTL